MGAFRRLVTNLLLLQAEALAAVLVLGVIYEVAAASSDEAFGHIGYAVIIHVLVAGPALILTGLAANVLLTRLASKMSRRRAAALVSPLAAAGLLAYLPILDAPRVWPLAFTAATALAFALTARVPPQLAEQTPATV